MIPKRQTYTNDGGSTTHSTRTTGQNNAASNRAKSTQTVMRTGTSNTQQRNSQQRNYTAANRAKSTQTAQTPRQTSGQTYTSASNRAKGGQQNRQNLGLISAELDRTNKTSVVDQNVNNFIDRASSAINAFNETGKQNQDYYRQRVQEKFEKSRLDNWQSDQDNRNNTLKTITDRDVLFDNAGNFIDYESQINNVKEKMTSNSMVLRNSQNENERTIAEESNKELQKQLDYYTEMYNKGRALQEQTTLDYYESIGDEETARSLREEYSHKDDSIWQRFGNAGKHLLTDTANLVPTAMDQIALVGSNKIAMEQIDDLEKKHESGEIDDELYTEALRYWNDSINGYRERYNDSTSQMIQGVINQYGANTYYGASDIEKFTLQAGESTAQFLLHYAIGYGLAGAATSMTGQALREAAGGISTVSMSMVSGTQKLDQLIEAGVDIETAYNNALLTGIVSYAVEKVGMDRFVNMLGTDTSVVSLGTMIMQNAKSGLSEGLEELVEGLIDPLIDSVTLGTDYTVNGSELLMEFLLGGVSGLATGAGANAIAIGRDVVNVNAYVNAERTIRANVLAQVGKLRVENREQYNLLQNEIGILKKYMASMTPEQMVVADEILAKGEAAGGEYEQRSQTTGVLFSSDIIDTSSMEDNSKVIYETLTPDFNKEVQSLKTVDEVQEQIDSKMEQLQTQQDNFNAMTQSILEQAGYNIPAEVFNKFSEKAQNQAMIALDFAKAFNLNVTITDTDGLREHLLNDKPNMTPEELENAMQEANGYVAGEDGSIIIDGTKERTILQTLSHELTHGMESSKFYPTLRELVKNAYDSGQVIDTETNEPVSWEDAVGMKTDDYQKVQKITDPEAEREVVARYVEQYLGNERFINDVVKYNLSLGSKIWQDLKALGRDDEATQIRNTFEKAFHETSLEWSGTPQFSIGTVFQAINMSIEKVDNHIVANVDGQNVKEVTFDNVKQSPVGNLMGMSVQRGLMTEEQADSHMQMYADLCNLILNTQDPDLVWAISGSLGYQQAKSGTKIDETVKTKSSAFTSNADKQYNRTFDVTTICNKTQQIINVMSNVMMKLDRGLTENEIVKVIYDETNRAGEPVPCPVCYVFSRWVGVGGLLDNIKNYQIEYENVDIKDLRKRYDALSKKVDAIAKREDIRGTDARDVIDELLNEEYSKLLSKQNICKLTGESFSEKDQMRLSDLEKDIAIIDRWSWIGKVRLSENYKPVPHNVLFDMNKGEEFANNYPETWKYRTTRGPAMGKAITPYTSEVLGQTIMGFAGSPQSMRKLGEKRGANKNPFLKNKVTKTIQNYFRKAIANARAQNLIGGSRAQSTSDFRFEYVLDYLIHFMELESIGSYGQTYTKVPEAVPMLASVNYETNMSLMAKEYGYKEVKQGTKDAIEVDGKYYVLDFSDVTGMNPEDAFRLASMYDSAQPIIVGINDIHMRLCMADPRITFIIPYHASGASEQRYMDLMKAVGESVSENARKDYSKVQNDTLIENATTEQKALRKARLDIIMGKATPETRDVVAGNEILLNLYDRFYVEGVDPDCYRNFLKKDQAEIIFPYEFWDKTSTIDTADINGARFIEYCDALGITPRFEEFSDESGYWKMLIDRPMYDLNGNYRDQKAISLDNFSSDFLFKDKMVEGIVQPSRQFDRTKTPDIAYKAYGRIVNNIIGDMSWDEFNKKKYDRDFVKQLKENGIKSNEDMRDAWVASKIAGFSSEDAHELSKDGAYDIIYDRIPENILWGWYRNADSGYKEKIETLVLQDKELRNAALNIMYDNYKNIVDKDISFNEFLNKEITMYRGTRGQTPIDKDVFMSYSLDEKTARKFGEDVSTINVKPIDTLGSYQTNLESEVLVPRRLADGQTNNENESNIRFSLGADKGFKNLRNFVENNPDATYYDPNQGEISYKEVYENMEDRLTKAVQMFGEEDADGNKVYTTDDIYKKTGWRFDPNDPNTLKVEFYDDGTVDKLANYIMNARGRGKNWKNVDYIKKDPTFGQILGEDSLFLKMYPEFKDIHLTVTTKTAENSNGWYWRPFYYDQGWKQVEQILISKRSYFDPNDPNKGSYDIDSLSNTIAHEIQHFIQAQEGFKHDSHKVPHRNRVQEIEAYEAGGKQEYVATRGVDSYGKMIVDDENNIPELPSGIDEGDVNDDEPTGGVDSFETPGELEDSNETDGQGTSNPTEDDSGNGTDNNEQIAESDDDELSDDNLDISEDSLPLSGIVPGGKKINDAIGEPLAQVLTETPKKKTKKALKDWARKLARYAIFDKYVGVVDLAEKTGNERLKDLVDWAMTSSARAQQTIYNGLYDHEGKTKIGKSLAEILGKLPSQDKQLFYEYMYQWRNVDDMSLTERFGEEFENKPVFGESFTADDSMERIAEIEKTHPEFKDMAEDLWEYTRKLLEMQVGGLISEDGYKELIKQRPHYIPISRDVDGGLGFSSTDANRLLKKMKGSNIDIKNMEETLMNYTRRAYETLDRNNLFNEMANTIGQTQELDNENVDDVLENDNAPVMENDSGKWLTFYKNGKKMSIPVDEFTYLAFKSGYNPIVNTLREGLKPVAKINQVRKNLLTAWNPFFAARNFSKDLQDAGWNTKYSKTFAKKYTEAVSQIIHNGEFFQQFKRLGGGMSNYTAKDLSDAFKHMQEDKGMKKFANTLLDFGEYVEMAPRLAEFMASLEAGNTVEKAMYDAAEVTTNFKRGGVVAKTADKYGFTFLNASLQGFDKHVRDLRANSKEAKKAGAKGIITLLTKLTLASGIPLRLLQDFIWKRLLKDKEYEELSDYIKNNYYILWKTNGGRFVRINKGRIATFYQTVLLNAAETVQGKANLWDNLIEDAVSFVDNIAPNNPLDNNVLAPLSQVKNNKTWYGDDIVSSRLQGYNDWEQYDESTDSLSKAIGRLSKKVADAMGTKQFELSPKKVNYLLDQYSGVIGDVVLPALTLETNTSINNPLLKGPAEAFLNSFTTDPVLKNQNVADFYTLNEQLQKDVKEKNATDEQILSAKYMATVSSEMGKLYAKMHEIQGSDLSNKEKMEQTRALKDQINELARTALLNYDQMDISGQYASVGGVQYYQKEDGSWVKPSKTALEKLDAAGLSDEDRGYYFSTYGEIDTIRKDIKSNTPEGQSADYTQATIDAINDSEMSYKGKNTLLDSFYGGKFTDHVNSMSLNDEEKYNLKVANKLAEGEKDKNGKTVANSKARATAAAYQELGLLDDVLDYIKDNNISPSEMGLSKTVYKELMNGDTSYLGAYSKASKGSSSKKSSKSSSRKKSSGGSKKRSRKRTAAAVKKPTGKVSFNAKAVRPGNLPSPQVKKNYLNAYSSIMNRGSKNVSSASGGTVTCPRCGNRVSSSTGRCPICGAKL